MRLSVLYTTEEMQEAPVLSARSSSSTAQQGVKQHLVASLDFLQDDLHNGGCFACRQTRGLQQLTNLHSISDVGPVLCLQAGASAEAAFSTIKNACMLHMQCVKVDLALAMSIIHLLCMMGTSHKQLHQDL